MDKMRDSGDRKSLLNHGRRKKRAGRKKEHVGKPSCTQFGKDIGGEDASAASGSRSARMNVLMLPVKKQQSAVVMPILDPNILPYKERRSSLPI